VARPLVTTLGHCVHGCHIPWLVYLTDIILVLWLVDPLGRLPRSGFPLGLSPLPVLVVVVLLDLLWISHVLVVLLVGRRVENEV